MKQNREYYLDELKNVEPEARPEVQTYFERQQYEQKLMNFIEKSFTFNDVEPLSPVLDEQVKFYVKE